MHAVKPTCLPVSRDMGAPPAATGLPAILAGVLTPACTQRNGLRWHTLALTILNTLVIADHRWGLTCIPL